MKAVIASSSSCSTSEFEFELAPDVAAATGTDVGAETVPTTIGSNEEATGGGTPPDVRAAMTEELSCGASRKDGLDVLLATTTLGVVEVSSGLSPRDKAELALESGSEAEIKGLRIEDVMDGETKDAEVCNKVMELDPGDSSNGRPEEMEAKDGTAGDAEEDKMVTTTDSALSDAPALAKPVDGGPADKTPAKEVPVVASGDALAEASVLVRLDEADIFPPRVVLLDATNEVAPFVGNVELAYGGLTVELGIDEFELEADEAGTALGCTFALSALIISAA
ncbi:hypothetical protein MMC08_006822 [Hypocenomyce scalaris]|nr:hypothetical protein [Hypocenomyce scalaris]